MNLRLEPVLLGALSLLGMQPRSLVAQDADATQETSVLQYSSCRWSPECSTPEGRLEIREVSREKRQGETTVTYALTAWGFHAGQSLDLQLEMPRGTAGVSSGYVADSAGRVVCGAVPHDQPASQGPNCANLPFKELDSLRVAMHPLLPGWPVRLGLISPDSGVRVYAKASPFPVFAVDGDCRIDVEFFSRRGLRIIGTGFEPGETVVGASGVGEEVLTDTVTAGLDGVVPPAGSIIVVLIDTRTAKGGPARYQLTGHNCRPSVSYPWGDQLTVQ